MRRTFALATLTMSNTLAVFVIQWLVVTRLGTGAHTDALFLSMVVPTLIINIVAGALGYVLVPLLTVAEPTRFSRLVSTFVLAIAAGLTVLSALLWLSAKYWVAWIALGFSAEALAETVGLIRVQLLGTAAIGVAAVLTSAYNARHSFVYPAVGSVISSVIALIWAALFLNDRGVLAAAESLALRPFVLAALQLGILAPLKPPMFRGSEFRFAIARLLPLSAGSAYYKTDQLVDRLLASLAPPGALSALHLAQQLYGAANQTVVSSMAAPALPLLAHVAVNAPDELWGELKRVLRRLMLAGALIFAAVLFPGEALLRLVLQHGSFSGADVHFVWILMIALGLSWIAGLSGQVLSNAFYAAGDTITPTRIGIAGFTIGVVLKVLGFALVGVIGIAIATGLYSCANSVAMFIVLRRRFRHRAQ